MGAIKETAIAAAESQEIMEEQIRERNWRWHASSAETIVRSMLGLNGKTVRAHDTKPDLMRSFWGYGATVIVEDEDTKIELYITSNSHNAAEIQVLKINDGWVLRSNSKVKTLGDLGKILREREENK
jgi:hypothetical protein